MVGVSVGPGLRGSAAVGEARSPFLTVVLPSDAGRRFPVSVGAARGAPVWPGRLPGGCSPLGGAIGDQAGHRRVAFVEVLAVSEVPLECPPLLVLGRWRARRRRVLMTAGGGRHPTPRGPPAGRASSASGAGPGPGRETAWPVPVAGIDFSHDHRVSLEQVADAHALHRRLVVHAAGPEHASPESAALPSGTTVAFLVFCRIFPETNARRPGTAKPRAAESGRISWTARVIVERSTP